MNSAAGIEGRALAFALGLAAVVGVMALVAIVGVAVGLDDDVSLVIGVGAGHAFLLRVVHESP